MGREVMQRTITSTTARGFTIKEGKPVEQNYTLVGKFDAEKAQRKIRQKDEAFSVIDVTCVTQLYTMTVADFLKNAKVETVEDNAETKEN